MKRAQVTPHVTLYRSGQPFPTGAVVIDSAALSFSALSVSDRFDLIKDPHGTKIDFALEPEDAVFGLGETLGGLNKRGRTYRMFATDEPHHSPDKHALYGSHPFLIVDGARPQGIFLDSAAEMWIDVGFWKRERLEFFLREENFDLYSIEGSSVKEIVQRFITLVGAPVLPPRWAFGYQQSRYSYESREVLCEIATQYRRHQIPCDVLYLDIDYMDHYKVFTVNEKAFPNLPALTEKLAANGFKLVPILDPGVKAEKGYDVFESGKKGGHFCTKEDGTIFLAGVWPGLTAFPDYFNAAARKWWGRWYEHFINAGIAGFWNDMNEPALFYTEAGIKALYAGIKAKKGRTDFGPEAVTLLEEFTRFWKDERYFDQFYHSTDDGRRIPHRDVHNLYGTMMAKATYDGVRALRPGTRPFVLSRSSYIGLHRIAALWTGDNHSWWDHLSLHVQMMLSLNLCGFSFCGADIGGFSGDASGELLVRWTQLGVLTPFFRNHSNKGTRSQEPWTFDAQVLDAVRQAVLLRYALIEYLYSSYHHARAAALPLITPLLFAEQSEAARQIADQFFCGETLLAAPVLTPNTTARNIYLPHGKWLFWSATSWERREMQVLEGGHHYVAASSAALPLFLRADNLLPLRAPQQWLDEKPLEELFIVGLVIASAQFTLIFDDGKSESAPISKLKISVVREAHGVFAQTKIEGDTSAFVALTTIHYEIYDQHGECMRWAEKVTTNGSLQ